LYLKTGDKPSLQSPFSNGRAFVIMFENPIKKRRRR
jgi:hypothetical protein